MIGARRLRLSLEQLALQKRRYHRLLLLIEQSSLQHFTKLYPQSETTRIFERRVHIARQDCDKAIREHEVLRHLVPKKLRGKPMTRIEEKNIIAAELTRGLTKAVDEWSELSPIEQDSIDMIDLQVKSVFELLDKLGLDTETLRKLNSQEAMVLPVKHYRHYKGDHYVSVGEGIHTETEEDLTHYFSFNKRRWFGRPTKMFNGRLDDDKKTPRFVQIVLNKLIACRSAD